MATVATGLKVFNETSNYLPPLPALRDFIKMYQLDAKKALSQNYLMDLNLARKIVRKSGNLKGANVLEIGPGPGGITRAILEHPCQRLDVVELDKKFIRPLEHLGDHAQGRLHIHCADILKTNIDQIWGEAGLEKHDWMDDDPPFQIIGNLPFHISTPLLIKLCKQMSMRQGPFQFGRIPLTFTFQTEVAERIVAPLDCKQRSRLGINCQNYMEPRILFEIPGKCFTPRPEINVCAVHFKPRVEPRIPTHFELTEKVVRAVFHFKRKFLRKAIKLLYPKEMADEKADNLLKRCRLDSTMNAPSLGVDNFADICLFYEQQCREIPGLYLFDHRHPVALEELAAHPNPFPPKYKKPVDALQKIEESGISLKEFDAAFMDKNSRKRGRRKGAKTRELEEERDEEGGENNLKENEN